MDPATPCKEACSSRVPPAMRRRPDSGGCPRRVHRLLLFLLFTRDAHLGGKAALILHEQVGVIILGTIFLFIGVAACCTAAIRGRDAGRILAWFGVFRAIYGVRLFEIGSASCRA